MMVDINDRYTYDWSFCRVNSPEYLLILDNLILYISKQTEYLVFFFEDLFVLFFVKVYLISAELFNVVHFD